jgi:hypothetical protein
MSKSKHQQTYSLIAKVSSNSEFSIGQSFPWKTLLLPMQCSLTKAFTQAFDEAFKQALKQPFKQALRVDSQQ